MNSEIIDYFKEKKILSAKHISKKFNIKKRFVIKYLHTNDNFIHTQYWDTGYASKHHLTFKYIGQ